MKYFDYYLILLGIIITIIGGLYAYELNRKINLKSKDKCSYCGFPLTDHYKVSLSIEIFKCKRWWCNFLKYLGYLKAK